MLLPVALLLALKKSGQDHFDFWLIPPEVRPIQGVVA
jgi:hypothetical protein